MTELEPQQNLYARLVQLRFTGDRSSSTWQAEVQGVLASSPATWGLAEIVNKLLKAESWEATPQVTRQIDDVLDIALRLTGSQLSAGPINRMVDEAVWRSNPVRMMKWLLGVLGPAVVAVVAGGTIWGVVQVRGINEQFKGFTQQIENASGEVARKLDDTIAKELVDRRASINAAFSELVASIRDARGPVTSAAEEGRTAIRNAAKDTQAEADQARAAIRAMPAALLEQEKDYLNERRRRGDEAVERFLIALGELAGTTETRAKEAQAALDLPVAEVSKSADDARTSLENAVKYGVQRIETEAGQQFAIASSSVRKFDEQAKARMQSFDEHAKQRLDASARPRASTILGATCLSNFDSRKKGERATSLMSPPSLSVKDVY